MPWSKTKTALITTGAVIATGCGCALLVGPAAALGAAQTVVTTVKGGILIAGKSAAVAGKSTYVATKGAAIAVGNGAVIRTALAVRAFVLVVGTIKIYIYGIEILDETLRLLQGLWDSGRIRRSDPETFIKNVLWNLAKSGAVLAGMAYYVIVAPAVETAATGVASLLFTIWSCPMTAQRAPPIPAPLNRAPPNRRRDGVLPRDAARFEELGFDDDPFGEIPFGEVPFDQANPQIVIVNLHMDEL